MIIGIPKEIMHEEARVAATPETVKKMVADGLTVLEDRPQSFYIAGKDRVFHPATSVKVEGSSVLVSNKKIAHPMAVRYGWSDAVITTVYNAAGLPASSFRTDDWDFYE